MSAEDFVTVPRGLVEELRGEAALAKAAADAATQAAARANAGVAELRDLLTGLREVLDQRIQGALLDTEETEPVADGFRTYRRRVLAREKQGA